jgi:two-component system, OmpR family, response regulator
MDSSSLYQPTKAELQPRVLIVEDIAPVATAVAAALRASGMETERAATGAEAIERKALFHPDIVLLDLQLPDVSGFDLMERFARDGDCGLIVVTAASEEGLRVEGLDRGADDYLVKPVPMRELTARIRALYRRLTRVEIREHTMPTAQIVVEPAHRCLISRQGERTLLSEAEFTALETLLDADGAPVSREWLGRVALKRPLHADDRSVDQLVLKLRRKLSVSGAAERTILSARRQGYVIPDPSLFRLAHPMPVPRLANAEYNQFRPAAED